MKEYFTYNDVLLLPRYSEITSRKDVDISTSLDGIHFKVPIVSANMDTITEFNMALAMHKSGGIGILHRFQDPEKVVEQIKNLKALGAPAIPSIGIKPEEKEKAIAYIKAGADAICIDVAHAHCKRALDLALELNEQTLVIAGNIATVEAAEDFYHVGTSIIKVGIGPGSLCTTRVVTGHGVPQLSAIMEIAKSTENKDMYIIADGGITSSGDIVKALAAGADAVMVGSLLAGSDECPLKQAADGKMIYRGMASAEAKEGFYGKDGSYTPEGVVHKVMPKGPVGRIIETLAGGIRSGLSYSGATDIYELREYAEFIKVTPSSYVEGTPHGLNKQ